MRLFSFEVEWDFNEKENMVDMGYIYAESYADAVSAIEDYYETDDLLKLNIEIVGE